MGKAIHERNTDASYPAIDEFYTSLAAAGSVLPFVPLRPSKPFRVWHPFSKKWSAFHRAFKHAGYDSVCSHIEDADGKGDFFGRIEDKEFMSGVDYIIDNPPFSVKYEVYKAVCDSGKPFALLMAIPYSVSHNLFDQLARPEVDRHFIWFKRRWNFYTKDAEGNFCYIKAKNGRSRSNVTFSTIYWTGNGFVNRDHYIDNINRMKLEDETRINGILVKDDTGLSKANLATARAETEIE